MADITGNSGSLSRTISESSSSSTDAVRGDRPQETTSIASRVRFTLPHSRVLTPANPNEGDAREPSQQSQLDLSNITATKIPRQHHSPTQQSGGAWGFKDSEGNSISRDEAMALDDDSFNNLTYEPSHSSTDTNEPRQPPSRYHDLYPNHRASRRSRFNAEHTNKSLPMTAKSDHKKSQTTETSDSASLSVSSSRSPSNPASRAARPSRLRLAGKASQPEASKANPSHMHKAGPSQPGAYHVSNKVVEVIPAEYRTTITA